MPGLRVTMKTTSKNMDGGSRRSQLNQARPALAFRESLLRVRGKGGVPI